MEIGTCPSSEVDLQIIDKSSFLSDLFMQKEEDKSMIVKELKSLVHLCILKQDMSPYSSPIMLIATKNSNLQRIITDFTSLDMRSQRVNLALPLIRDDFGILGSSKSECLSMVD